MTDHVITGQAVHCQVCQGGGGTTVKKADKLYGQVALKNKCLLCTGANGGKVSQINKLYKLSKYLVKSSHGKSQGKLKKKTP